MLNALAALLLAAASTCAAVVASAAAPARAQGAFVALASPARLLDTRGSGLTVDGEFSGLGMVGTAARPSVQVTVRGRAGVPSGATAVVVNVTVTGSQTGGYVTLWPGGAQPPTSTLNFEPGQTIANAAIVGTAGSVRLFASAPTHVILDITGYFSGDGTFAPLSTPARLADTRGRPAGVLTGGETLVVPAAATAGVSDDAAALALNVTVTGALQPGYLTVYPCGSSRPNASSLNYEAGDTVANAVVARPGTQGRICIFASGAAHVIVDVGGWFASGGPLDSLRAPARALDTRSGGTTSDGQQAGGGLRTSGSVLRLPVAGRVGVPATATAVVLNVTVTAPQAAGYITAFPSGVVQPDTSNLNFAPGQTIPNAVIAGVGPDGAVCLFTSAATHLIVDVTGYLTGAAPSSVSTSCTRGSGPEPTPSPDPSPTDPTPSPIDVTELLVARSDEARFTGTDKVGVWVCNVPPDSTGYVTEPLEQAITAEQVASWATSNIASYYRDVSRGRFLVTFTALGVIDLTSADDETDCLTEARLSTDDPFTNVLAVSNRTDGGGFAGPGLSRGLDSGPPSETRRGMYLGGGTVFQYPSATIGVHELGHTLNWPHSYLGSWQYDNAIDMMSGDPATGLCVKEVPGGRYRYACAPQHTVAFNRFAAGWIDDAQVVVHRSGTATYTLTSPATRGTQMVAATYAGDEQALLTIEARPAVGYDRYLDAEGVAVHRIDQRGTACGASVFEDRCSGIVRRVAQAVGPVDQGECGGTKDTVCATDHVIDVGQSMTVHGVTIRVIERVGDSYRVSVSGSYQAPASLPQLASLQAVDVTWDLRSSSRTSAD